MSEQQGIHRNSAGYLHVLIDAAHALSLALEDKDVINVILEQTKKALKARATLVRLLSADGNELLLGGALGLSERYLQKGVIRLAESEVDQRALAGEQVVIPDVTRYRGFQYPEEAEREGLKGMIVVPLRVRERAMGVLRVYVDDASCLSPADILLVDALADLGALTLEKVRLMQSLCAIGKALNSSLELDEMLQRLLAAVVSEMALKAASIRLLDKEGKHLRLVAAHGLSKQYLSKGEILVDKSPVDQKVLGSGEAVVLYDVLSEPGFQYPEEALREGIRSALVVPLHLKDRTLGLMRVYSARPRHFTEVGIHFLSSVAHMVALAIEKAQLYATLQERYEDLRVDLTELYRFLALG